MTEKEPKSIQNKKSDLKYLARRKNNREAVNKHRLKKALEDEMRRTRCDKLINENRKLEGQVSELKNCRQLLKEILEEQLKKRGQQLSAEQLEIIKQINDDDDDQSEDSSVGTSEDFMTDNKT